MKITRTLGAVLTAGSLTALAACGGTGQAGESGESFPSDTIRLVTPYDAGGPSDLTARAYAESMSRELGQQVVVENKPGGSGAVGTQELITSSPDGYTIGLITTGTTVSTPLTTEVGYTKDDLTPLGVMSEVGSALVTHKSSPFADAEEFFAAAEAKPGGLKVGVPGASTPQAIEMQRLGDEYGVEVSLVPFDGNAEMITALLGKNVDGLMINSSDDVIAQIDNGTFRPLAVAGTEPDPGLPGTPTLVELGYDKLTMGYSVYGLAGPSDLPDEVAEKLTAALGEASVDPKVIKTIGDRFVPDSFKDAEDLDRILQESQDIYEPILGK